MSEIVKREWNGHVIRMITIDGVLWLYASDVCRALGLQRVDSAVRGLSDREKRNTPTVSVAPDQAKRGGRAEKLVTQHGASKIIMKSRKPEAEPFVDWIAYELIPAAQEQRVARMPSEWGQELAVVQMEQLDHAMAEHEKLGIALAGLRQNALGLVQLSARTEKVEVRQGELEEKVDGHRAWVDDELIEIKTDIWARKSEIPRKTCRGWAAKAARNGRLLIEPNDANLLRLGRRVGKLCRELGIEKQFRDDDRHDEVGYWPVEQLECAARELQFVRPPSPRPRSVVTPE